LRQHYFLLINVISICKFVNESGQIPLAQRGELLLIRGVEDFTEIHDEFHYELVRVLAEGGMGMVYEGRQKGADHFVKQVAIKIIKKEYSAIKEFRDNFVGEARLVADLIHTNIVQTYHLGCYFSQYYMVMEYVNGVNLDEFFLRHLETNQYIPIDIAVFIISRICRGLAYAHQKKDPEGRHLGLVHRDVNPRNVLISFEGDVKLTDFGIAKALNLMYNKEGEVIAGKDEYLSPEQICKEVTDPRADLFCCGLVLVELLLGYHFFEDLEPKLTHENILHMPLPDFVTLRKGIDPRLNDVIHKMLQRHKEKRYQTGAEMLNALEEYLYGDHYGPTNEKLALYIKDLFSDKGSKAAERWKTQATPGLIIKSAARVKKKTAVTAATKKK
jgi:serine/threonine protein kinase